MNCPCRRPRRSQLCEGPNWVHFYTVLGRSTESMTDLASSAPWWMPGQNAGIPSWPFQPKWHLQHLRLLKGIGYNPRSVKFAAICHWINIVPELSRWWMPVFWLVSFMALNSPQSAINFIKCPRVKYHKRLATSTSSVVKDNLLELISITDLSLTVQGERWRSHWHGIQ